MRLLELISSREIPKDALPDEKIHSSNKDTLEKLVASMSEEDIEQRIHLNKVHLSIRGFDQRNVRRGAQHKKECRHELSEHPDHKLREILE